MAKSNKSKLLASALKAGSEVTCAAADYLTMQHYAESVGMRLKVVKIEAGNYTIKAEYL